MNKGALGDLFTRLLGTTLKICVLLLLNVSTFSQNELFEEASLEQMTREFAIDSNYGRATFALHAVKNENKKYLDRIQEILVNHAPAILNYFKYVPQETMHLRLNTSSTRANGSATVFPRNIIVLNLFPPAGSEHLVTSDDWLQGLVIHELVHIVHLDRTEGVLKTLTNIFGSIGKLGGVVPRWFSEGLAVWAETHFTKGGRLRNAGLVAQAKYFLAQENFCHTIDCLDAPGEYPYGNFSYWVGGLFLDYLESLRKGTLACLVETNSSNFPFFLRNPFEICTGARLSIEGLFQEFRQTLLKPARSYENFLDAPQELISIYQHSQPLYERGFELTKDSLYWVSQNFDAVRLKQYDLRSGQLKEHNMNDHVDHLLSLDGHLYRSTSDYRRLWEQKTIRKDLGQNSVGQGDFIMNYDGRLSTWRYQDKAWRLYQENREVFALPVLVELIDAREQFIAVKDKSEYLLYHLERSEVLYRSKQAFRLSSVCDGLIFLKNSDSLISLNLEEGQVSTLSHPWTKDVISLRANDDHVFYRLSSMPDKLIRRRIGCRELQSVVVRKGSSRRISGSEEKIKEVTPSEHEKTVVSYPQAKHFKPHWWFFSYLTGDVITQLTLSTSINDPLDRHRLNLNLQYFDGINKIHPTGSYTYNWSGTDIGFGASQSYIQNASRVNPDQDSSYFIFMARSFFWRNVTYRPSLNASYFEESDIISNRKGQEQTLVQSLSFSRLYLDDFFQGAQLTSLTRHFAVDGGQSYFGQEFRLRSEFQPLTRFYTTIQGSYGKLFKDTLRDGILYSGSANDYDVSTLHEFIGINPNSAFGNEVATARFLMNYEVWRVQRGWGFMPLFLRTLNALVGSDYLKTKFIFTSSRFLRDSFAQSYYVGARANITLAYFVPMQLDVLQVRVNPGAGPIQDETRFFLRGTLPF